LRQLAGAYLSARHDFIVQFVGKVKESSANNGVHQSPLTAPFTGFITEMRERYLGPYRLLGEVGIPNRAKAIVLVIYLFGIAIAVSNSAFRANPSVRFLLIMTLIVFSFSCVRHRQ
jgi:hypothetical protein